MGNDGLLDRKDTSGWFKGNAIEGLLEPRSIHGFQSCYDLGCKG